MQSHVHNYTTQFWGYNSRPYYDQQDSRLQIHDICLLIYIHDIIIGKFCRHTFKHIHLIHNT